MIKRKTTLAAVVGAFLVVVAISAEAQIYYGSQLMTPAEQAAHRARMWSLPPGQREAYRAQHHAQMKKRAAAMGHSLPDRPPVGRGLDRPMGPGYGWGRPGYWRPSYNGWGRPGYNGWGRSARVPGYGRGWHRGRGR